MLDSAMENLISSVVSGDNRGLLKECSRLLESGVDPQDTVLHGLAPAMEALDSKCSIEDFDLLSIMLAGRCALQVSDFLYSDRPVLPEPRSRAVLGTITGDVHNLGKNIIKAFFMGSGYFVTDLGTGMNPETFVGNIRPYLFEQGDSEDMGQAADQAVKAAAAYGGVKLGSASEVPLDANPAAIEAYVTAAGSYLNGA